MTHRKAAVLIILASLVVLLAVSFLALFLLRPVLSDDERGTRRLRVASVTIACDPVPTVNEGMLDMLRTIRSEHHDVELVLFGELITGWYSKGAESRQYHQSIAEPIPGETTDMMSAAAREFGLYVSFGMSEASNGKIYNSQVLIDPGGSVVAVHRKVNLQGSRTFERGSVAVTIAAVKGIRTAVCGRYLFGHSRCDRPEGACLSRARAHPWQPRQPEGSRLVRLGAHREAVRRLGYCRQQVR